MKRLLAVLLLLCAASPGYSGTVDDLHIKAAFGFAHRKMWNEAISEAKAGKSGILQKYFVWGYLRDPESDATFDEISSFIEDNPDWPDQPTLLKHAEVAILSGNYSDEQIDAWFAKHPPQTAFARRKGARSKEELNAYIREAWVTDDYAERTEQKLLARYHSVLRSQDHIRRIDRLLWEGKTTEAKRLLKYVPYGHQRLFTARISLMKDKGRAPMDVVNVPPQLAKDSGLIYERLRWRMRHDDKEGAREMLLAAPEEVSYPEKWWPLRDRQVREALGEGNPKLAMRLMENDGQKPGSLPYKEAKWLRGWIALEYLNKPETAYHIFADAYGETETPAGKSRVAYWAGRAAQAARKDDASHWFDTARHYPTTFYGQLATAETDNRPLIDIPSEQEPTAGEKERFRKRSLVQLVYALGAAHETDAAGRFILYLVDEASSPADVILATRLGREIDRIDFSVRASKKALNSDIVSLTSGWPVIRFHSTQGIETPLLLALSRQESEFFADAESPSGALGLMQLLPSTAKEIARKNGIGYSVNRLYDPSYNMTLGSLYLRKMLDGFDGSYVLAVASYNAGPGRVGQWLREYGRQGRSVHEAIDWVERIPNTETRNYVQHVLANTQVYRFMLAGRTPTPLMIGDDMVR